MGRALIINEHSGGAARAIDELTDLAKRHGADVRVASELAESERFARRALDDGVGRLAIAGGDGTINAVINAIAPDFERVAVAVLPCGTANDLARSLGVTCNGAWDDSIAFAFEGPTAAADVVEARFDDDRRFFINACSGGTTSNLEEHVSEGSKKFWGSLAYWIAGAAQLADLREYGATLGVGDGGREQELELVQVAVANGRYVGGGVPVVPDALLDDGKLDLIVAPPQSALDLADTLVAMGFGRHVETGNVLVRSAERLELKTTPPMRWSIDGDLSREVTSARFEVRPRVLRLVADERSPAFSSTAREATD